MSLIPNKLAGSYSVTWNSLDLGQTSPAGITMQLMVEQQPVQSDQYGESTILDFIHTGARLSMSAVFRQRALANLRAFIWQWTSGNAADEGKLPIPGSSVADTQSQQMVLTPFFDASLAGLGTNTVYTFPHVVLDPGNIADALNTRLREVTLRWYALPYSASGVIRFYTTSNPSNTGLP